MVSWTVSCCMKATDILGAFELGKSVNSSVPLLLKKKNNNCTDGLLAHFSKSQLPTAVISAHGVFQNLQLLAL